MLTALPETSGRQVAYNVHFRYTFVSDTPRNVTGQDISDFFVATPHLKERSTSSKVRVSTTVSGGGYAY
jgi:hypothetical protein